MSSFAIFRAKRLPVFMRIGRVGAGIFALSLVLGALTPQLPAFASPHNFTSRLQIDANKTGRWLLIRGVLVLLVLIAGAVFLLLHPLALQAGGQLAGQTGTVVVGQEG